MIEMILFHKDDDEGKEDEKTHANEEERDGSC